MFGKCSKNSRDDEKATKPRIGLVLIDDGLYNLRWVRPLLDDERFEVLFAVCLSPFKAKNFNPAGAEGLFRVAWQRMRYYGPLATFRFARKAFIAGVLDILFCLRLGGGPQCVASAARSRKIAVPRAANDINNSQFCAALASYRSDLLICAFSQKATETFLSTARIGCLNVHFSVLPDHRGREPLFRAMLSGKSAGVSLHWMTSELDAGVVVCQRSLDAKAYGILDKLIEDAGDLAGEMIPEAICKAMSWQKEKTFPGELPPLRSWPTRKEVDAFKKKGFRFV